MHFLIIYRKIGGETLVIFHITGAVIFSVFTGKFIKQVARAFTKYVNQHIETATVSHTQYHIVHPMTAGMTDDLFHHRNKRIASFQRETFRAREFRS